MTATRWARRRHGKLDANALAACPVLGSLPDSQSQMDWAMWKLVLSAVIGCIIGVVIAPVALGYIAKSFSDDNSTELMKTWSSEGKSWVEYSRFIDSGGRAYWSGTTVFNCLAKGMDEDDLRKLLGPPDAVLIGKLEISNSFNLGPKSVPVSQDRRRPLDYVPYLHKETTGIYVYKMGRVARDVSYIERNVMILELSSSGKLATWFNYPVSDSNPVGDYMRDTRTDRRVRSS